MTQCLVEVIAHLVQELADGLLSDGCSYSQRVHEHTNRIAYGQISTTITDSSYTQLLGTGKARQ